MLDADKIANSGARTTKLYVPGKSPKDIMRELGIEHSIKMSSNENPLGTSTKALKAYAECGTVVNMYPDADSLDLSEKIARRLGCSVKEVTLGAGVDGVLYNLAMALIDQNDEAVLPELTFPVYETTVRVMRGKPVKVPMKGLRIDLDALRDAVTPATKILFLCNPNNPTGDVLPPEDVKAFLKDLPENLITVVDEAYIEFTPEEFVPPCVDMFNRGMKNLVILRTFSKLYGLAGLRVGYGVCDETVVTLIKRIKPPFNVSVPAQAAALAALDDEAFGARTVRECNEGKEYIYRELDELGLSYVRSGTNFILIDTCRETGVVEALMHRGVIVRSAAGYGKPSWIRVTVGTADDNRRFIAALKSVLRENG